MVKRLVRLHDGAVVESIDLPREGIVTIGRRPENSIVCADISVSGQHCKIHCKRVSASAVGPAASSSIVEVEDCSTNGTFVNAKKLPKQTREQLSNGDIMSMTKPASESELNLGDLKPRVQFRFEVVYPLEETPENIVDATCPGFVPHRQPSFQFSSLGHSLNAYQGITKDAEGFAQDLLVQEQQSKAKITGEFMLARRRLDEERTRAENLAKELQKANLALREEQARRTNAQDAGDKLQAEAVQLRAERRQLQDLRSAYDKLHDQNDSAEVELTALVQKIASLEASQERTKAEVERAQASSSNMQQQVEDLQARLQRAQEHGERLNGQRSDERARAEQTKQLLENLQKDMGNEKADRERLEDQQSLLAAELEGAQKAEGAVQELLTSTLAQHNSLKEQADAWQTEAAFARSEAQNAQCERESQFERVDSFRAAAKLFGESVRAQVDLWMQGLFEGSSNDSRRHSDAFTASRQVVQPTIDAIGATPPRSRFANGGESAKTERGVDETGGATSQEEESVATHAHAETPDRGDVESESLVRRDAFVEAPTPRRILESPLSEQAEAQSSLECEAQVPGPTLPPLAPPWSLQILGEAVHSPGAPGQAGALSVSPLPADTELLGDTAISPAPKRRRAS